MLFRMQQADDPMPEEPGITADIDNHHNNLVQTHFLLL
jgi:hypothetical protein